MRAITGSDHHRGGLLRGRRAHPARRPHPPVLAAGLAPKIALYGELSSVAGSPCLTPASGPPARAGLGDGVQQVILGVNVSVQSFGHFAGRHDLHDLHLRLDDCAPFASGAGRLTAGRFFAPR